MEVILVEDFPSLGYVGDKVKVKAGYGRNFLVPRGMAIEASTRNAKLMKHRLGGVIAKKAKLKAKADEIKASLEKLSLEFTVKMGESGKSFGSITARDIEGALKEKSVIVDRKQIRLLEQMKTAGDYQIEVKLHSEVAALIPVKVIAEAAPKKDESRAKKGKKRAEQVEEVPAEEGAEIDAQEAASEE